MERILLIDDSEGEALFVRSMLRDAGLEDPVIYLQDPAEALRYLNGDEEYADREKYPIPDVILLDLTMPRVDGYEILRWIRGRSSFARMAVIVLTGEVDPKRIQLAYQLGATSYLSKGASLEEFRNFVQYFRGLARISGAFPRERAAGERAAGESAAPSAA